MIQPNLYPSNMLSRWLFRRADHGIPTYTEPPSYSESGTSVDPNQKDNKSKITVGVKEATVTSKFDPYDDERRCCRRGCVRQHWCSVVFMVALISCLILAGVVLWAMCKLLL